MKQMINKLLGENTIEEEWGNRDSIEFNSVHDDTTCKECGIGTDNEYCQLCTPYME